MVPPQVGEHCDDACIVEWLIPYLLNFVIPDTTSATRASVGRHSVDSDALARGVALRHLGRMWGRLAELPRSEWGLFNAYLVPACSSKPDAPSPTLRRDLFLSLPRLATAAQRLSVATLGSLTDTSAGAARPGNVCTVKGFVFPRPCASRRAPPVRWALLRMSSMHEGRGQQNVPCAVSVDRS